MGRFDEIKNKINANINENGEQRITGQVLNEVLIDEVNTIDEAITELEESIGQGSGITEEKEVYIGEEEPPVGAKVWIDPQGTPSQPSAPSAGVEVIDNLESDSATAALSANQGRVLKEMIVQSGGGSANDNVYVMPEYALQGENGVEIKLEDSDAEVFRQAATNWSTLKIRQIGEIGWGDSVSTTKIGKNYTFLMLVGMSVSVMATNIFVADKEDGVYVSVYLMSVTTSM